MSQLRSLVERVERLDEEIKALNDDKRDIYAEAKANGYDVAILKKVVSERRKDASTRDEQSTVFDLYWNEIHGLVQVHDAREYSEAAE